jgi:aspartate racemase
MSRPVVGVLGGVGPLASARFLTTLYQRAALAEQELPRVIMVSDPTLPDRTLALRSGELAPLRAAVIAGLEQLLRAGAEQLVLCCFTLHHFVSELPEHLRARLLSLPRLALELVLERRQPAVLLCSTPARALRVFEREPLWPELAGRVRILDDDAQRQLHDVIYGLKSALPAERAAAMVAAIVRPDETWICGCTELHLVSTSVSGNYVDPLLEIAARMPGALTRSAP